MNRHHYSLYVHNCRLILLLRQEPTEAENYKPAEFHWKLDQVWRQSDSKTFTLVLILPFGHINCLPLCVS